MDGQVNADDYHVVDEKSGLGWYSGDFNYDGVENADDYFLMDSAFITQDGILSAGGVSAAVAVPEPTAAAAGLLFGMLTMRRRFAR